MDEITKYDYSQHTVKGFQESIINPEYLDKITKHMKKHMRSMITKYIYDNNLPKYKEMREMTLEMIKKENKYNLNDKQYELLDNILKDKYSVGAFMGMIFNAKQDSSKEKTVPELIKDALDVRLLAQEMLL
jgi:hypothetical protein